MSKFLTATELKSIATGVIEANRAEKLSEFRQYLERIYVHEMREALLEAANSGQMYAMIAVKIPNHIQMEATRFFEACQEPLTHILSTVTSARIHSFTRRGEYVLMRVEWA